MSIRTREQLEGMRRIGSIIASALKALVEAARPGVRTQDLDAVCRAVLDRFGARPTPEHEYGFPGSCFISVNDEVVHGVPGARILEWGDVITVDVTADLDGYIADAARTVSVGTDQQTELAIAAKSAFDQAMTKIRPGTQIREIGAAIESEAQAHGFSVVRELCGHGVGQKIHEEPTIPNFDCPLATEELTDGLVITVEPIVASGSGDIYTADDDWTIISSDHEWSAHYEETLVVTPDGPLILTADQFAA